MVNSIEKILKKIEVVKLETFEDGRNLSFRVRGPISHEINTESRMVGHFIKTLYDTWLPTLEALDFLTYYFMFLRCLCEVTNFPSEQTKRKLFDIIKDKKGEISVIDVCEILYEGIWDDVLVTLRSYSRKLFNQTS